MNDRGIGPTHVGICHGGTQGNNGTQSGNQFNEPSPRAKKNKKSPVNGRVTKRKKKQNKKRTPNPASGEEADDEAVIVKTKKEIKNGKEKLVGFFFLKRQRWTYNSIRGAVFFFIT